MSKGNSFSQPFLCVRRDLFQFFEDFGLKTVSKFLEKNNTCTFLKSENSSSVSFEGLDPRFLEIGVK